MAAILAEREISLSPERPSEIPLSLEILVPRVGDYLIQKGVLGEDELQRALEYQSEMETSGQSRLIGQALVELGFVDHETLDQAITEQIFRLQAALQQANRDLEERVRERTAELQHALNRLGELNQLKSNFIANISHELRTPLTHIRGYIELFLEKELGPLTDQQVAALEVMERSEMRLEHLIEDLIQFSVAARGEFELDLKPTNLKKVMNYVLQKSSTKIGDRNISVRVELPEDLPEVQADPSKLMWSISQLVDNAIKFTADDGLITLGARVEGPLVVVYVDDNGIGIPEQKVEEIFEPFHQLDGSSTRRTGGTGLGLALVQRIVEAHGSQVKVRSQLGEGSRFEFAIAKADDGRYV